MRNFIPALLTSKIRYALPLYGCLWGIGGYNQTEPKKLSFTKNDLYSSQSIQRSAAILVHPANTQPLNVSTESIFNDLNWLTVHQNIAYSILMLAMRILKSGVPRNTISINSAEKPSRKCENNLYIPRFNLNIGLESFANQAPRLFNMIPDNLKNNNLSKGKLKQEIFKWVTENISAKP